MIEKEQALLAQVMDVIAQRFDKHAVLRGGMVLRLLGCERLTNDLEYVFVPFKSKKDIVADVLETLAQIPGATMTHSLNSQCLRVVLTVENTSVQVEAKVALTAATDVLSTANFAREFGCSPRLVPVLEQTVGLAHKMAAWNERRLIRDLYDIWFLLRMGVRPDVSTLEARLQACTYSKLVPPEEHFGGNGAREFLEFLRTKVAVLTDKDVTDSLSAYLPPAEIPGLSLAFRAELAKLRL